MTTTTIQTNTVPRNLLRLTLATAVILSIPLLAQWPWTLSDFVIMGILIFGVGCLYIFGSLMMKTTAHRIIFGAILTILFLLTWAELAVGLFGTPFAGS